MSETTCDCVRHKMRSVEEKKAMMNRLKRIEGQIRGIQKMVEDDLYCVDIMNQVAAARAALNSLNVELLNQHMHSCVVEDLKKGNDETLDELLGVVKKMMK